MRIRTIKNCVRDGVHSIARNGLMSVASIGTISACLFILGLTYTIIINVQQMISNLDSSLGIVIFLEEDVDDEEAEAFAEELEGKDGVSSAVYISPEQAWDDFKDTLSDNITGDLLDELDEDNPLSESANIEIYMDSADAQSALVEELENDERVRLIRYSEKAANLMSSLANLAAVVGIVLMVVLMLVAVLLIANTIKLSVFIRHTEINIMKYIGATDAFIRLPFVVEGMLLGLLGTIIPSVVIYFGYYYIVRVINNQFSSMSYLLTFVSVGKVMSSLIPMFLVLGVLVGTVGSLVSIRKHLKV